ncbi:MAG: DciA family protein [Candidatus Moraniibacteriota bacterium]
MRTLKDLLPKRQGVIRKSEETHFDEQTVFYIAKKVLGEEYGLKGSENITPTLYKEKKLFLSSRSSLWGNEIWLERERLQEKINRLLGSEAVREIKIDRG